MTPTFKERVRDIVRSAIGNNWVEFPDVVETHTAQILSLVMGIVPPEFKPSGCIENDEAGGFNDCRQAILNEMGGGDE